MRKEDRQEMKYLLHIVEDEDVPGESIFLGSKTSKPSRFAYYVRIVLATITMIVVTFISLTAAQHIPEILYSIPIYGGFVAIIIYPLREPT